MEDIDDIIGRFDDVELQDSADSCDHKGKEQESESGDLLCAICLCDIPLEDVAMVKGCDHMYCAYCILQWTLHNEKTFCPTCKQPFSYLLTYRGLDGSLNDFPMEESVVLLRRAHWFEDWIRASQNDASQALLEDARVADDTAWMDDFDDDAYWKEDEEMEAFYFSSAAGKARIVLGNRRFGQGGFISGGHRQARPVKNSGASGSGSKKKAKNKGQVKASIKDLRSDVSSAIQIKTPNNNTLHPKVNSPHTVGGGRKTCITGSSFSDASCGSSPSCAQSILGSSPSGFGRRAKRNARRNAERSQQLQPQISIAAEDQQDQS